MLTNHIEGVHARYMWNHIFRVMFCVSLGQVLVYRFAFCYILAGHSVFYLLIQIHSIALELELTFS